MKPFVKKFFTLDGGPKYEGYNLTPHLGLWNGYSSPGFTYEQAIQMLEALKVIYGLAYEFDKIKFITWNSLYPDHSRDVWVGRKYETEDGNLVLYPIGSWNWVWTFRRKQ